MRGKSQKNTKLIDARSNKYWSQQRLAIELGTAQVNISRWELGTSNPSYYFREKLCEVFGKTMEELGFFQDDSEKSATSTSGSETLFDVQKEEALQSIDEREIQQENGVNAQTPPLPQYWLVPYERDVYFTDRDETFKSLIDTFFDGKAPMHIYAMSGLPGVGKTQIAIEYLYRSMSHYQAVFWLQADNAETLFGGCLDIAHVLNLPEKNSNNQAAILHAVLQWLNHHSHWLLIFDNVERLDVVTRFFVAQNQGHILLTMRAEVIGKPAIKRDIDPLEREDGSLFLLRRAGKMQQDDVIEAASIEDQEQARKLSAEMGGLPLALDQAGAYIEELACTLSEYRMLYSDHRKVLLERRGDRAYGHPDSLVATILITLKKIQMLNPAAVELLYLYAFLHPESIPKTILKKDIPDLRFQLQNLANNPFLFNEAVGVLSRYALIQRVPTSSDVVFFRMHRLVQDIVKDFMEEKEKRQWAEQTVQVVYRTLSSLYFTQWSSYHQYIAHAQICVVLITDWDIVSHEAAQVLTWVAGYYLEQGRYSEAKPLIHRSLSLLAKIPEAMTIDTLENLNALASLYVDVNKYRDAEQIYQQTLATLEQEYGELNMLLRATIYNNLGEVYDATGQYEKAEELFIHALTIREHIMGPEHEFVAISLYCLANLYVKQGKYTEAERYFQRSFTIREQRFEENHGDIAASLNGMAANFIQQRRYEEAEPLLLRALHIREKAFGPDHTSVAQTLNNLGNSCLGQQRLETARSYFQQALHINEALFGTEHRDIADSLIGLAFLDFMQNHIPKATLLFDKALAIRMRVLGPNHPDTITLLQMKKRLHLS